MRAELGKLTQTCDWLAPNTPKRGKTMQDQRSTRGLLLAALFLLTIFSNEVSCKQPKLYPQPNYETKEYWTRDAQQSMDRASRVLQQLRYSAKNVILFIGDGMGVSTVTAGRILKGQLKNSSGEEASLAFDEFDHAGLIRTYNMDRQTPDSASTATAFMCGVKTNGYMLGVNQDAKLGSCSTYDSRQHDVVSFLKFASEQGKATGVLTTDRLTGATPAPAYASSVSRQWQDDTDRNTDDSSPDSPEQRRRCPDIATQLVDRAVNFTVLMGGGRLKLLPKNVTTMDQFGGVQVNGTRSDGINLVERWSSLQRQLGRRPVYVETADELRNLRADQADSVLGLLSTEKMRYHSTNIRSEGYREPSLADMTRKALEVLRKNSNGFALMVEGARIDSGHHANQAQRALYDVLAFDEAVQVATEMTSIEDTLIVVSADHSHVFTIGHYGYRGQPILGKMVSKSSDGSLQYPALVPRHSESHSAEDVALFARGPGAHLFQSVHQQSYIGHVIMKAGCLGWYARTGNCLQDPESATSAATVDPALPRMVRHRLQSMDRASRVLQELRYSAKNVILFIGDGMGVSTVTAGRILKGQLKNSSGEEASLAFDEFDHAGLIRTYNLDRQTPDSAATATAFLCGVKTNFYTLGVNQNAKLGSCSTYDSRQHDVVSFLKLASEQGRATGVVTTSRLTGATPAPAFASCVSRRWQDDTDRDTDSSSEDTVEQRRDCPDIATQMVDRGVNFTVLMGGGRLKFLPKNVTTVDQVTGRTYRGTRSDGVNLVERWKTLQGQFGRRAQYVETADDLRSIQPDNVDSVLALTSIADMQYHVININSSGYREPSLADMTKKTLEVLTKNPKGFALLVEGGRIDNGHHGNRAQRALYEVVAFDEAIQTAMEMTSIEDTLIVVSADHSHVFTIGYYGRRGQPVLGKVMSSEEPLRYATASDGMQYTAVSYGDGPGAEVGRPRRNISEDSPESSYDYRYPSLVPRSTESHAGEDVSVMARGPGAQLFHSVHQQSYIAHVIMKAACLGWYADTGNCLKAPEAVSTTSPGDIPTTTTKSAVAKVSRQNVSLIMSAAALIVLRSL
uniref:alkaline phosphatase n=2 Tax=Macrostomum lignano TaxID=282301 RepID=A0A1I8IH46_9PLAT